MFVEPLYRLIIQEMLDRSKSPTSALARSVASPHRMLYAGFGMPLHYTLLALHTNKYDPYLW